MARASAAEGLSKIACSVLRSVASKVTPHGIAALADRSHTDCMRIAIAADHAGFPLKARVVEIVRAHGHEPVDLGTHSTEPVDYPDIALALGTTLERGDAERGVLICGSGVGASVAANKVRGIRAAVCHDTYSAHQGVEHDNMNVLALGARIIGPELMAELVGAFLRATFSTEERHRRRVAKIVAMEDPGPAK
jgi:ribose 5-phosphate isomerase B